MSNLEALRQLRDLDLEETQVLVIALLEGEGRGCSTGEIEAFVSWAEGVLASAALLGCVLNGEIVAKWSPTEDDWVFSKRDAQ